MLVYWNEKNGGVLMSHIIKTEQDIEDSTGLLVLCSIPNYDVEKKKRRKGGRR